MKYQVEVREKLSRVIVVEAPDEASAIERVEQAYDNSEIVLDSNDMIEEKEIEVLEDSVPDDFEVDYEVNENVAGTPNALEKLFNSLPEKDKLRE